MSAVGTDDDDDVVAVVVVVVVVVMMTTTIEVFESKATKKYTIARNHTRTRVNRRTSERRVSD